MLYNGAGHRVRVKDQSSRGRTAVVMSLSSHLRIVASKAFPVPPAAQWYVGPTLMDVVIKEVIATRYASAELLRDFHKTPRKSGSGTMGAQSSSTVKPAHMLSHGYSYDRIQYRCPVPNWFLFCRFN